MMFPDFCDFVATTIAKITKICVSVILLSYIEQFFSQLAIYSGNPSIMHMIINLLLI